MMRFTKETLIKELTWYCKQLNSIFPEQALRMNDFITIDDKQFNFTIDLVLKEINNTNEEYNND